MIITGTIATPTAGCTFMLDTKTGRIVQLGGEKDIVAENISLLAEIITINPDTIAEHYEDADLPTPRQTVTDTFTKDGVTVTLTYPEED